MLYYALARLNAPPGRSGWRSNALVAPPALTGAAFHCRYGPQAVGHEWCLVEIRYAGDEADVRALDSADSLVLGLDGQAMGDLTVSQRSAVLTRLDSVKASYQYTDQHGVRVTVPELPLGDVGSRTLRQVHARLFEHFQHRKPITMAPPLVEHNTEYTDNFSTDVSGRWTETEGTGWAWDDPNDEYDQAGGATVNASRYDGADTGSLDMESQTTINMGNVATNCGPCTRFRPAASTYYTLINEEYTDTWYWTKVIATSLTIMGNDPEAQDITLNPWITIRLATQTNGSQVDMSGWISSHGTSKPSDPGWIGVDGSPTDTYSDTAADRMVDSDARIGGIFAYQTAIADWFKTRALSDRSGASVVGPLLGGHLVKRGILQGRVARA